MSASDVEDRSPAHQAKLDLDKFGNEARDKNSGFIMSHYTPTGVTLDWYYVHETFFKCSCSLCEMVFSELSGRKSLLNT